MHFLDSLEYGVFDCCCCSAAITKSPDALIKRKGLCSSQFWRLTVQDKMLPIHLAHGEVTWQIRKPEIDWRMRVTLCGNSGELSLHAQWHIHQVCPLERPTTWTLDFYVAEYLFQTSMNKNNPAVWHGNRITLCHIQSGLSVEKGKVVVQKHTGLLCISTDLKKQTTNKPSRFLAVIRCRSHRKDHSKQQASTD